MKQFSLEEYLKNPSRKVVTRDGEAVKIHCINFDDDEYPIRYYSKDEEMSEEGRKADAGECLTDEYIENNMNS